MTKQDQYVELLKTLHALLDGEDDAVAMMATIACELKHFFPGFSWTGFYRVVKPGLLKVGPYQGGHGCLTIPFGKGVCGTCAATLSTQRVPDVTAIANHIACSSKTRSEIVVPVFNKQRQLIAVLDINSEKLNHFDDTDRQGLESVARFFQNLDP